MKLIPLTQGKFAKVDDEDFEWLNQYNWYAVKSNRTFYARTKIKQKNKEMHRMILQLTNPEIKADHENGDGLDNQRHNLRTATYSQNNANRKKRKGISSSKYLGVHKNGKRFVALCKKNNIKYTSSYKTENEAALAYNELAKKHHGEFARLNIIQ